MVSGAAALIVSAYPEATPDQVKRALTGSATPLANQPAAAQGSGELNLNNLTKKDFKHVDATQVRHRLINQVLALFRTGHVHRYRDGSPAHRLDLFLGVGQPIDSSGAHRHVGAGFRQGERKGHAQS